MASKPSDRVIPFPKLSPDEIKVYTTLLDRATLAAQLGVQYGTSRDLYEALGYKTQITYDEYAAYFGRHDIAKAVINRPVDATWRGGFTIVETDDDNETPLEKAWVELDNRLKLLSKFSRLDRLAGLGYYGVLMLGLSDAKTTLDFAKAVQGVKHKLLYVKPFSGMTTQASAQIQDYVKDPSDPRYGQPLTYNITVENLSTGGSETLTVHHSRVIHVVDGALESEIEGTPRLEAVFNRLMDLEKIVGGSAEMFWRGARPGYQGKVAENFTLTPEMKALLKGELDEFEHNLRRVLLNEGISWEALAQQVSDPKGHVDVQLMMISAVTGIPLRVLTGSERGELASNQDRDNWFDLIDTRRAEFAEPQIIRPFVDRCVELGILPEPKEEYSVRWVDLRAMSDKDKAEVGAVRANAIKSYVGAETVMPLEGFYRYCLGLADEEIELLGEMKEAELEEEARAPEMEELEEPPAGGEKEEVEGEGE